MATVYEFGNLQFFKDLVFGWTFIQEGTSYPVSQMDLAQITKVESFGRFPAYVPEDFYTAVTDRKKELSQTESEKTDTGATSPGLKSPKMEVDRSKDRAELLATILENMVISEDGKLTSKLPYCTISRKLDSSLGLSLVWKLTPTNSSSLKVQLFASIDDLATWVLRTFW